MRITTIIRRALHVSLVFALSGVMVAAFSPLSAFADAQSDLGSAQAQLEEIGKEYESLQQQLIKSGADLEITKGQIEQKQQDLASKQAELAGHVSNEYKNGGVKITNLVFNATSFNELLERVFYMDKVSSAQAKTIDDVKTLKKQLDEKKQEQERELAATQKQVDELGANQKRAQALVSSLSSQVKQELEAAAQSNAAISSGMQSSQDSKSNAADVPMDGGSGGKGGNVTPTPKPTPKPTPEPQPTPTPSPSPSGDSTINSPIGYALAQAGKPYVPGGCSPSAGFDCSGLVWYAYHCININLGSHTAHGQEQYFRTHGRFTTNISELQYGDVVFFSGHVAFYVGGGKIFGARVPGTPAGTSDMKYFPGFHGGGQLYR